jgi:cobalamin-dependent methionine synthase I
LAANEKGYHLLPLGANMPLAELARVAGRTRADAIVLSGAVQPSKTVLGEDLARLASAVSIPVFVGGPASVFAADAIRKAGAEALGQDMELGLRRLGERLR